MAKRAFTKEERQQLRENHYTFYVSERQISFTKEFKEEFWRLYIQEEMCPEDILIQLGYDPEILGTTRISGIQRHVKAAMMCDDNFHSKRMKKINKPESSVVMNAISPKTMEEMRHELMYLRQEVEYLKKIFLARGSEM